MAGAIAALWNELDKAGVTETWRLATVMGDEIATVQAAMGVGRDDEDELVAVLVGWAKEAQGAARRSHGLPFHYNFK